MQYAKVRQLFLTHEHLSGHRLAVLVSRLPEEYRNDQQLAVYFARLYPDSFHSAVVARDVSKLNTLIAQREAVVVALEESYIAFDREKERPRKKTGCRSSVSSSVGGGGRGSVVDDCHYSVCTTNRWMPSIIMQTN